MFLARGNYAMQNPVDNLAKKLSVLHPHQRFLVKKSYPYEALVKALSQVVHEPLEGSLKDGVPVFFGVEGHGVRIDAPKRLANLVWRSSDHQINSQSVIKEPFAVLFFQFFQAATCQPVFFAILGISGTLHQNTTEWPGFSADHLRFLCETFAS